MSEPFLEGVCIFSVGQCSRTHCRRFHARTLEWFLRTIISAAIMFSHPNMGDIYL
jgi:hypothetical protein